MVEKLSELPEIFKAKGLEGAAKLFHFHVGSQLTDIRTVKDVVNEGARIYAKLRMFKLGILGLEERALVESLFWRLCRRLVEINKKRKRIPGQTRDLEDKLADQYMANFSLFQSAPDAWAVHEVHVFVDDEDPEDYYIEEVISGDTVERVLARVQYEPTDLAKRVKQALDARVREGVVKLDLAGPSLPSQRTASFNSPFARQISPPLLLRVSEAAAAGDVRAAAAEEHAAAHRALVLLSGVDRGSGGPAVNQKRQPAASMASGRRPTPLVCEGGVGQSWLV